VIWRILMLLGVVATGVTMEEIWPWFPTHGLVAGAAYWIGTWKRDEN
jgi:hypothetical protein